MREIEPIGGACVWHGSEMAGSPRWHRRLSPEQLAEIDRALAAATARGLGWQATEKADFPLPAFTPPAEAIRAELDEGSGIPPFPGIDPERYSMDQLKPLNGGL